MIDYKIGDVVKSTAGHDKGIYYVVVGIDGEFVLAANGKTRAVDSPKRKKSKHIAFAGSIGLEKANELGNKTGAFSAAAGTGDSELRKLLKTLGYNNSKIMIER